MVGAEPHEIDRPEFDDVVLDSPLRFTEALAALKRSSPHSYQVLARRVGRPVSTIHGWCTGRHLPYSRDNGVFEQLLRELGVRNTAVWMAALYDLRHRNGTAIDTLNPYRGLEPFTEDDGELFHGRSTLVRRLVLLVEERLGDDRHRPLMVIGASGSGKTSLLRAGLHASLRDWDDVTVHYLRPTALDTPETLDVRDADDGAGDGSARVIIIDQFEEAFAAGQTPTLERLVSLLLRLRAEPDTAVVIGMRADFFHRAAAIPVVLEGLQHDPLVVGAMSTEEVTECIIRPAERVGLTVEPELLTELVAQFTRHVDAHGSTEALPLLSHVLYQLAEHPDNGRLTLDRYRRIGGLPLALQRSADEAYAAIPDRDRPACRFLFANLVELGSEALPTRRAARLDELRGAGLGFELDAVIDEFAGRRLLTTDVGAVSISHESLLTAWPRLAHWIDEEREALRIARRVQAAAQTWMETGEDPDALLRGTSLEAANGLLAGAAVSRLTADERRFLTESRDADQRRRRHDAEILSRQLAAQAVLVGSTDPPLGAQLAVVAHGVAPTVESRSALLSAASAVRGARFVGGPGATALAVSGDGHWAASSNAVDGSVTLYRCSSRSSTPSSSGSTNAAEPNEQWSWQRERTVRAVDSDVDLLALALSPDGRLLAMGGTDRRVTLVDLDTNATRQLEPGAVTGVIRALAFEPDGRRLRVGADGGDVVSWKVAAGPRAGAAGAVSAHSPIMAVAAGTERFAASTVDGTVAVWSSRRPSTPVWSIRADDHSPASAVALGDGDTLLVAGFHNGLVRVWRHRPDTEQWDEVLLTSAPFASWVNAVDVSPDGRLIAAASSDGHVRLWETSTWREIRPELRHPTVVTGVRFADGDTLLTTAEDGTTRVWDVASAAHAATDATIWSVTFDATGHRQLTASRTRVVVTERCGARTVEHELESPAEFVPSGEGSLSPDGTVAVLGTRQGPLLAYRLGAAGREMDDPPPAEVLDGLTALVEDVAFSADGRLLGALDQDGTVRLWTCEGTECGSESLQLTAAGSAKVAAPARGLALSPDGSLLAITSESGQLAVFGLDDPHVPTLHAEVQASDSFAIGVAVHPDRPLIAVGSADRTVTLWDCNDPHHPTRRWRLDGPAGHVITLAFSPDGHRLAAGITDGTAWVWDLAASGPPALHAVLTSGEQGVYCLTFTPDGRELVGAGPRHRVFRWHFDEDAATHAITASVGDPMTAHEWATLVPSLPGV